jgi:hypothetical protein
LRGGHSEALTKLGAAGGNPAFKLYDIDPDTLEVMDAKVYMSKY